MFTSTRLIQGEVYSRSMLAKFFGLPASGAINTGVVQPDKSRYRSVWLFVTEEKDASMPQFRDKLEGDNLSWQGQTEQGTDKLIINHNEFGLELIVFYRKSKRQHPNAGFVFEGRFEYKSHVAGSKPTDFVLKRSPPHQSIDIPSSEQLNLELFENFIHNGTDLESTYFLCAVLWLLREAKGLEAYFMPSALVSTYIASNILYATNSGLLNSNPKNIFQTETIHLSSHLNLNEMQPDKIWFTLENHYRVNHNSTFEVLIAKFLEQLIPVMQRQGSAHTVFEQSRSAFDNSTIPLILSNSKLFLHLHPLWMTYLSDNNEALSCALLKKLLKLADCKIDITTATNRLLYFDKSAYKILEKTAGLKTDSAYDLVEIEKNAKHFSAQGTQSDEIFQSVESPLIEKLQISNSAKADAETFSEARELSLPRSNSVTVEDLTMMIDHYQNPYCLLLILSLVDICNAKSNSNPFISIENIASNMIAHIWLAYETYAVTLDSTEPFESHLYDIHIEQLFQNPKEIEQLIIPQLSLAYLDDVINLTFKTQVSLLRECDVATYLNGSTSGTETLEQLPFLISSSRKFLKMNAKWLDYFELYANQIRSRALARLITDLFSNLPNNSFHAEDLFPFWKSSLPTNSSEVIEHPPTEEELSEIAQNESEPIFYTKPEETVILLSKNVHALANTKIETSFCDDLVLEPPSHPRLPIDVLKIMPSHATGDDWLYFLTILLTLERQKNQSNSLYIPISIVTGIGSLLAWCPISTRIKLLTKSNISTLVEGIGHFASKELLKNDFDQVCSSQFGRIKTRQETVFIEMAQEFDHLVVRLLREAAVPAQSIISASESGRMIEINPAWLSYLSENLSILKVWVATQLSKKAVALNPELTLIEQALFPFDDRLSLAVKQQLDRAALTFSTPHELVEPTKISAEPIRTTENYAALSNQNLKKENFDPSDDGLRADDLQQRSCCEAYDSEDSRLPPPPSDNINSLDRLFSKVTTSYKFLLFQSIFSLCISSLDFHVRKFA